MNPLVSAIITTRNSSGSLQKLLESIKDQSYPSIEIIVVDNKSKDNTKEIALKFTKKVFDKGPERSAQRNFGADKASGKFVYFLDSDMILTEDVIKDCVGMYSKNPNIGGIIVPETSIGEGFWTKAKILEREINEGESFFEAARFFLKKLFTEIGGYNQQLTGPEDWDLPRRIAKKHPLKRIESRALHQEGRHTLIELARRKYYYGLSVDRFLKVQKLPLISPTTVYFLRPAFYRHWKKIFRDPVLGVGMLIMLSAETIGGFCGYIAGKYFNDK